MRYRQYGESEFNVGEEYTFHTQRPSGSSFTFAVQADPHGRDPNANSELYKITLHNELADNPDFLIDLGDTFMTEQFADNYNEVVDIYVEQRHYFGIVGHSAPLFLVMGNHDGESGQRLKSKSDNLAVWATKARKLYYLNPAPDSFYTGSTSVEDLVGLRENYYAWEWGDALFVVLDPYWYVTSKNRKGGDNWERTLGHQQYSWFKETLEQSDAAFKFVFCHQLVGGDDDGGRGGIEFAQYYEWGGQNKDGSWGFDDKRPGWGKPIHQLMVENNVTIFFHGHDHAFVKQELDGIVYQLVPQPSHSGSKNTKSVIEYGYVNGDALPSSGHIRVNVSENKVAVDYIRAYLPEDEKRGRENGEIAYSYTIMDSGGADSGRTSDITQKGAPLNSSEIGQPILISEQFSFTEGPLWDRTSDVLLFSDINGNTIYKLTLYLDQFLGVRSMML